MADDLQDRILAKAKVWAQEIQQEASSVPDKPKHIFITVTSPSVKGGAIGFNATATSPKGDARAYEYGSGIHSTSKKVSKWQQGAGGKILITPKRAKVLAFHWQVLASDPPGTWYGGQKLIKKSSEGKAIFRYVEHPGVKAAGNGKGYLRPAIAKVRRKMRVELKKIGADAYIGGVRRAFKK